MSDDIVRFNSAPGEQPVQQEKTDPVYIAETLEASQAIVIETHAPVIDDTPVEEPSATSEEQPKPASEPDAAYRTIVRNQRVIQDVSHIMPNHLTSGDKVSLPSNFDRETVRDINNLPNIGITDNPEARRWAQIVNEGLQFNTMDEVFVPALEDPNAEFRQHVDHAGAYLAAAAPKMKPLENQNLKGERAIIRLTSHLGLGTIFQVPLWHSGFWITFKPPTDSEIVEFNRLFASDKIQFGRQTYGLAFSNTVSYTTDRVLNFALSHIYDTTIKPEDINLDNIRQHISTQDIHTVIWGFICTMYPRGFLFNRACTANPEKCNHTVEETLNVSKLLWTNTQALTDWQKTHMSYRQPKSRDLASVTRYKEELSKIQKNKKIINEGLPNTLTITIKTPTATEYIDSGHKWIGDIVSSIEQIVGNNATRNEKDALITKHAQATSIRQYAHWIDCIEMDSNIIDDKETVETALENLSSDDEIRNQIIKAVVDYINNSVISVIGIPVYDCPACGSVQSSNLQNLSKNFINILPLDIIQVFFDLVTQRIQRLADR